MAPEIQKARDGCLSKQKLQSDRDDACHDGDGDDGGEEDDDDDDNDNKKLATFYGASPLHQLPGTSGPSLAAVL
jgi:hypothetical protein